LDAPAIRAVVDYLYTAPALRPQWGEAQIRASRVEYAKAGSLPAKPVFAADPLNLFVVVETGDHHATILDGDTFEPVTRFATRYALHGGPKFSPDGRYVYFASRDGWISKYDIWNLTLVAEVRAGINTRNLAVSGDGRFVMVGNTLPRTVVLLDAADLSLLQVIDAADGGGKSSRVSAVYDAAPRASFIVALKDVPEVWEVRYAGEGSAPQPGADRFPVRRIALDEVLDDFFLDPGCDHLIGAARGGRQGQVVDLNAGRRIAVVDLPGLPHLGSGISWEMDGRPVLATPNLKEGLVTVIDMQDWKTVAQIRTAGAGFFLRSHENTPYAWVDAFNSASKDTLQIIDKRSLEVVGAVTPAPGHTVAHVEFTRDGRYALASLWENDGALIVYDAATFKEIKRVPMVKPSGKYNVYNKTTRSAGTSH
ncbi:MAG TPA: cytochrome D1 domain-containing protein, partial [Burkholderiaceae bacterium]